MSSEILGVKMEMFSLKNVIQKFSFYEICYPSPQTRRQVSAYEWKHLKFSIFGSVFISNYLLYSPLLMSDNKI